MIDWQGIWIPLVTPQREGAVDRPALHRLVQHLAAQGVAGFMPCGSTGEAALLSADEQEAVLATTLAAAGGLPVVMGLSGANADAVADRAQALAGRHAVAAILLAAPAYVRPSQGGLLQHFRRVADRSPVPLVVYDVPARTGVRIDADTLLELAAHPNIVAVKDCSGDRLAAERVLADGRLAWLAGNDDELFDQLARGAAGGVTVSAHVDAARFVALHRLMRGQQLSEARLLWRQLAPLTRALFAEPNPAPVKGLLTRLGWLAPDLRAPLTPATAATIDRAQHALNGP